MGVNSLHWYYIPILGMISDEVILDGDEWHHCFHVMRMRPDDHIVLCNGKGICMEGVIRSTSVKKGTIELINDCSEFFSNPRSYKVHVALAPTKNMDRTGFAVEKMVEIGVDEIYFLECDHNERSHLRPDRMEKISISAAKQSKKSVFPILHDLISIPTLLERMDDREIQILGCHLGDQSKSIEENYFQSENVLLLIGPEGGFSIKEIELMKNNKVKFTHLGPFRLRVETAAIVACANIHLMQQLKK